MKIFFLLVVALCGLVSPGVGALRWATTQIEQAAPVLAESVVATYRFTNTGDAPVVFKEIKVSCDCTTTVLDKMNYAPGESGVLEAKLAIGNRLGLQTKTINVTVEGEPVPTVLTMLTTIPTLLEIKPGFVFWPKGQAAVPKTVTLTVGINEPVRILRVMSDNPLFNVELDAVEAGKSYRITLFPLNTGDVRQARITVLTDYPKDKPRVYYLLAQVK